VERKNGGLDDCAHTVCAGSVQGNPPDPNLQGEHHGKKDPKAQTPLTWTCPNSLDEKCPHRDGDRENERLEDRISSNVMNRAPNILDRSDSQRDDPDNVNGVPHFM
jgi:hypothetical protein